MIRDYFGRQRLCVLWWQIEGGQHSVRKAIASREALNSVVQGRADDSCSSPQLSLYRHAAESTTIVPGTRVLLFHWSVSFDQRLAPVVASNGTTRT